ncbi:hypothetical protein F5879DRAFT_991002 [Lentinula edodes]|uniref:uncharacterized protein n=1 Tax=Lentinula edodes TaxID=5353 RepID=UPI001E8D4638|nr:uncharacterized protein C8R40DRAFT_1175936 [Lentinula edodes]KAH7870245.1 hypothetical protein C8R40DRAFT_1175936 [Lentinula edodes]KAJ3902459.1 hypothetical protein F5879DRAFT_991002 [Lentinula edodes]
MPPWDLSGEARAAIKLKIMQKKECIKDLEMAIKRLETDMLYANMDLTKLLEASAPIWLLPKELLARIFWLCCRNTKIIHSSWGTGFRPLHSLPMITLGLVCKFWHSLVNEDPLLWSTFEMEDVGDNRVLDHLLERSSSVLLDCTLSLPTYPRDPSALLTSSIPRWKRLSLSMYTPHKLDEVFGDHLSFKNLRSLEISHICDWGMPPNGSSEAVGWTWDCPQLVALKLVYFPLEPLYSLQHLATLTLAYMDLSHVWNLLKACRNIRSLVLEKILGTSLGLRPVLLSHCHSLCIREVNEIGNMDVLMEHLDTPILQMFEIGWKLSSKGRLLQLVPLVTRHSLMQLHIQNLCFPSEMTQTLLGQLACLQELVYQDDDLLAGDTTSHILFQNLGLHCPSLKIVKVEAGFEAMMHVLDFCDYHPGLERVFLTLLIHDGARDFEVVQSVR